MDEEDDYTCDPNDDDSAYDAWADNRVEEFYARLEERISIMKELVELWNDKSTHTNNVDRRDPDKTPILTPSIYSILLAKAKFPTNKLIVKPIPVKTETPYKLSQVELLGI